MRLREDTKAGQGDELLQTAELKDGAIAYLSLNTHCAAAWLLRKQTANQNIPVSRSTAS